MEVHNDRAEIERVEAAILAETERHDFPRSARFAIKLAFEEAIVNAFHHGHREVADSEPVTVSYRITADEVAIAVEDRGPGFDPGEVADPTLDENLDVPSGRGLMLIRAYMTEVRHNDRGNRLEMFYRRPEA